MNYELVYRQLITKGLERGLDKKKLDFYTERHHIIPRCMKGSDDDSNIVLLTAREHYIAHKLLIYIYPQCTGLIYALHRLCKDKIDRNISSREYQRIKILHSIARKEAMLGGKNPTKGKKAWNSGKKLSLEIINKIRASSIGIKKPGTGNALRGRKRPTETVEKSAKSNTGLTRSIESKINIRNGQRTKPHWKFEDQLKLLWISYGKITSKPFRRISIEHGYPDVDYNGMIKSWIRSINEEK